jgi:hypothetical protein
MAYGVHYRIEYKDSADIDKKIDIEELDYTVPVIDCEAADDPLGIEQPVLKSVFDPVITAGATIKMLSTSNMMFLDLYSKNPKKLRVKIYQNGASDPFWLGYINTEVYNESYARIQDYPVTVTCNNGFSVLERYKYMNGTAKYTGFASLWTILQRILTVMDLPYNFLYFASTLVPDDVEIDSDETLFHNLFIDQANYYDESEEPKTCLEVLEEILKSEGLQILWHDGSLYIIDPALLYGSSFSAKKFNSSSSFIESVAISRNLDISNDDCEWNESDQALDIASGYSKQKIHFSPYSYEWAIPSTDLDNEDNWTGTPVWTHYERPPLGDCDIEYLSGITAISGLTLGPMTILSGKRDKESATPEIYLKCEYYPTWTHIRFQNVLSGILVNGVRGKSILFKCKIYIRTKEWENDDEGEPGRIEAGKLYMSVQVGDKKLYFNGGWEGYSWLDNSTYKKESFIPTYSFRENLADNWRDFEFRIPWNFPGGEVLFTVYNLKAWASIYDPVYENPPLDNGTVKEIRFKDIEWKFIDVGSPGDNGVILGDVKEAEFNDKEYTGKLDEDFMNEAPEIELTHADSDGIADRGALRKPDYSNTDGWRKTGDSTSYRLVDILMRSITSQYRESLHKLTGTLTASALMSGTGCLSFFNTIQDTDYLGERKFLCLGGVYNDFKRTLNGTFLEIKEEDLDIVIE